MRKNDHIIMGVLFGTLIAVIALLIVSSVGCLPESGRSGYAEPTFRHSKADNDGIYYGDRPGLRVPEDSPMRSDQTAPARSHWTFSLEEEPVHLSEAPDTGPTH